MPSRRSRCFCRSRCLLGPKREQPSPLRPRPVLSAGVRLLRLRDGGWAAWGAAQIRRRTADRDGDAPGERRADDRLLRRRDAIPAAGAGGRARAANGNGPMEQPTARGHPGGQSLRAGGARLGRSSAGRGQSHLAGSAVASRCRPSNPGARAHRGRVAEGVCRGPIRRIRERQHRPDLWDSRAVARWLARRAQRGGRPRAGPPLVVRPATRSRARRVGCRAPARRAALAATAGEQTGRRSGRRPVSAGRGASGCCWIPPLRAELLVATRPRVATQRGVLGSACLHGHRGRRTFLRRARRALVEHARPGSLLGARGSGGAAGGGNGASVRVQPRL